MAVIFLTGFDGRLIELDQDGAVARQVALSGTAAISTLQHRTGPAALRCNPASGASGYMQLQTPSTKGWVHFGLYIATMPSVARVICGAAGSGSNVKLNSTGKLEAFDGSTTRGTTTTTLTTGVWYWIGWRAAAGTTVPLIQIAGTTEVTGTVAVAPNTNIGLSGTEASAADIYIDDVIIDGAGFLGPSNVGLLLPISDNGTHTGWQAGAGGTTNLWQGVDNVPPAGLASASETNTSNIENTGTAGTYTANLQTYTTGGVGASDTVLAVQSLIRHGEDIITGTKTGTVGAATNPTITGVGITFGSDLGAHGADPGSTFWVTQPGTLTTSPSVTLGTSPTLAAVRPSESRTACIDFMGLLVAWTPAVGSPSTTANAVLATGTGAAANPAPSASLYAVLATATGASTDPAAQPGKQANAVLATATGASTDPTLTNLSNTNAVLATGTGSAAVAGPSLGRGAVLATGTGASADPAPSLGRPAVLATGTGASADPAPSTSIYAILATGTGASADPAITTTAGTTVNAILATGTGASTDPASSLAPGAVLATGTGASTDPALSLAAGAVLASGTGAATDPAPSLGRPAVLATGSGTSISPAPSLAPGAVLAAATGTSADPAITISAGTTASAVLATGTGASTDPALTNLSNANAVLASATGASTDPAITTSSGTTANAVLASGTGASTDPAPTVAPGGVTATGAGASADPAIISGVIANAVLSSGTGSSADPAPKVAPGAVLATGTGAATDPAVSPGVIAHAVLATALANATVGGPWVSASALAALGTATAFIPFVHSSDAVPGGFAPITRAAVIVLSGSALPERIGIAGEVPRPSGDLPRIRGA
jgi:hypothetical protein